MILHIKTKGEQHGYNKIFRKSLVIVIFEDAREFFHLMASPSFKLMSTGLWNSNLCVA